MQLEQLERAEAQRVAMTARTLGGAQDIDALVDIFAMRDELERFRFTTATLAAVVVTRSPLMSRHSRVYELMVRPPVAGLLAV